MAIPMRAKREHQKKFKQWEKKKRKKRRRETVDRQRREGALHFHHVSANIGRAVFRYFN